MIDKRLPRFTNGISDNSGIALSVAKGIKRSAAAEMLPCWAVMVVFDRGLDIEWDGAFVLDATYTLLILIKPGSKYAEGYYEICII